MQTRRSVPPDNLNRVDLLPYQELNQVLCLDRAHVFLKDGIEVHVSPSEYVLCKSAFFAIPPEVPYINITTLEVCFLCFTHPAFLNPQKNTQRAMITSQKLARIEHGYLQSEHELTVLALEIRMLHMIAQLKHVDLDPSGFIAILDKIARDSQAHFTEYEEFLLKSIVFLKKEDHSDVRKRISKHFSGANYKFKEVGIGIQILSVGQSEGYMPTFTSSKEAFSFPL